MKWTMSRYRRTLKIWQLGCSKFSVLFGILAIIVSFSLNGEIQKLQVKWQAPSCSTGCAQLMIKQFQAIPGVAQVYMNQPAGQMDLRWKPNYPFSFTPINNAMAMVGLSYTEVRIRVRGYLQVSGNNYSVVSLGDNTPFVLLAPAQAQQGRYVIEYNIASHQLTPYLIAQLQQGIQDNRVAVVEGPLFQPERSPPLYLVIQQLNYVITEEEQSQQKQ